MQPATTSRNGLKSSGLKSYGENWCERYSIMIKPGELSRLQFPISISIGERRIGLKRAAALVADQRLSSCLRASAGPPLAMPSASATAFIAPALVPLIASM